MNNKFIRTLYLGINSLLLHKLRSGLAVLGILIGVTAVIWLVAMGEGVSYQAQQQIKDLGATNIIVRTVKPPTESSRSGGSLFVAYGLLRDDFDRIMSNVPTIQQAVPMREIRMEIRYRDRAIDGKLIGCTSAYKEINHLTMDLGRFIEDRDGERVENFCVVADGAAKVLFPYENPIGRRLQISGNFYTIIGKTQNRNPSAAIGGSLDARDYNQDVYIPLRTLRSRIGDMVFTARGGSREGEVVQLSQITLTVGSMELVDETAAIIRTLLDKFHSDPDYSVVVPKELLRQAELMRMLFNGLLVLIAGISLVVGGIGIMNIMLATVTERTREIGVRRALGAKQRDIIQQFLSETIVLSGVGGMLGVLLGFTCGPAFKSTLWLAGKIVPDMMASLPPNIAALEPRIAPWSIFAAFGISVAVGVMFGLYPARRAALMDPIEALRHE